MLEDTSAFCVQTGWNGDTFLFYQFESLHYVLSLVEIGAREHFIENNSQCPNITFLGIFVISVSLGRHISRRPNIIEHFGFFLYFLYRAIPKIDYFWHYLAIDTANLVEQQNIFRFQISMDDTILFKNSIPFKQFLQNTQRPGRLYLLICRDILLQGTAFKQLHGYKTAPIDNSNFLKSHNRLIIKFGRCLQCFKLTFQQIRSNLVINLFQGYNLDGDGMRVWLETDTLIHVSSWPFA